MEAHAESVWPSSPSLWAQLPSIPNTQEDQHTLQQQQQESLEQQADIQDIEKDNNRQENHTTDEDENEVDFALFDIGNPWTQVAPATQVHRKQWLRGFKAGDETSSDALDMPSDSPRATKRRRLSRGSDYVAEEEDSADGLDSADELGRYETDGLDGRPTKDIRTSHPPLNTEDNGQAGDKDPEDVSESNTRGTHNGVQGDLNPVTPARPHPLASSYQPILSEADREALSTFLDADLSDSDSDSDSIEVLETPPPELLHRRRGLARMISELKPEQKEGYWAQFDDYRPPTHNREERLIQSVPPQRPLTRLNQVEPETPIRTVDTNRLLNTDSRLLPNRPASALLPQPSFPYSPHIARLDETSHREGTTLIARSRNSNGMGLATKTWKSTWKDDERGLSRVVRGRVVRSDRGADAGGSGSRGRGKRGRGRGRGGKTT